jgi:hypothetical protein
VFSGEGEQGLEKSLDGEVAGHGKRYEAEDRLRAHGGNVGKATRQG